MGHTGTLDPFATGLLVALVGGATRTARYFNGLSKTYTASVSFGSATDTDDRTGEVVATAPLPSPRTIEDALDAFRGDIEQLPPAYSAIHVGGRRAYELARRGETVALPVRSVSVHELSLLAVDEGPQGVSSCALSIRCSAGTYIRSIARDLGIATGSRAHVSELRRTAVGPFHVDEAACPDGLDAARDLRDLASVLERLGGFRRLELTTALARRVAQGGRVAVTELEDATGTRRPDDGDDRAAGVAAPLLLLVYRDRAVAIASAEGGRIAYELVIPQGVES